MSQVIGTVAGVISSYTHNYLIPKSRCMQSRMILNTLKPYTSLLEPFKEPLKIPVTRTNRKRKTILALESTEVRAIAASEGGKGARNQV